MRNIFAERVELRLSQLGMSRSDLARRLGRAPQNITQTLNKNTRPQQATLEKWAKALETSPDWLMGVEVAALALDLAAEKMLAQDRLRAISLILAATSAELAAALPALEPIARRLAANQHQGSG